MQTAVCGHPNGPLCFRDKKTVVGAGAEDATESVGWVPGLGEQRGAREGSWVVFCQVSGDRILVKQRGSEESQSGF